MAAGGGWQPLAAWLGGADGGAGFDGPAEAVQSRGLACRLTARRRPEEVAARRRQRLRASMRKKGRDPSARQLVACDWLVLATSVPAARLSGLGLWVAYRCRWQVELLFKRGKQQIGWAFRHGRTGARVLTEVLAKLLGAVVVLWATLLSGGPLAGRGPTKQFAAVRRFALRLWDQVGDGAALHDLRGQSRRELGRLRPQPRRRKRPSTRQLLLDPELAA